MSISGDIMMHVGDIMSKYGRCSVHQKGYHEYIGPDTMIHVGELIDESL